MTHLVQVGMAYSNHFISWACAPLLVPKARVAGFSSDIDLRPINRVTVKHQLAMPSLELELAKTAGSKCYELLGLSNGY